MKKYVFIASLVVSNSVFAANIANSCERYLNEFTDLIAQIYGNEAMRASADMLKVQLDQTRAQLAALPMDQQDTICKQGLNTIPQVKASMGLK